MRLTGALLFSVTVASALTLSVARRRGLRLFSSVRPPVAQKVPAVVYFGKDPNHPEQYRGEDVINPPVTRADPYFWCRDETRKNPEVLSLVNAENAYSEGAMKPLEGLRESIYKSMLSRLKETDEDLPYPDGPFLYYARTIEGKSYKIHCRKAKSEGSGACEQVILDENEVAKGQEYSVVGAIQVCPSHRILAWSWDTTGDEHYDLQFLDLSTGKALSDVVNDISGDVVWSSDGKAVFYTKQDAESRPYQAYMHIMGTSADKDLLLFTEEDQLFWMGIDRTADRRFLVIGVESKETSESHLLDLHALAAGAKLDSAEDVKSRLQCIEKRQFGVRYDVESHADELLIVTNKDKAKCNKLVTAPIATPGSSHWKDVRPYDAKTQIDGVLPFKTHMVVFGRQGGLERVWIAPCSALSAWTALDFAESCYTVRAGPNEEYEADRVRLVYSSLITPKQTFEVPFSDAKSKSVLKCQDVPCYDSSLYRTCRIDVTVRDGTKVPVSLVFKASLLADPAQPLVAGAVPRFSRTHPTLLYGYGSYGACIDPAFDYKKITLLDHDMIYAIAHIRGGGELGQWWYEDVGKYLTKLNTFNDFGDVARGLIEMGMTETPKLGIVGRSAGGLLVGATLNRDGHLFKCAVADVPFVDAVNTMSDPTIPLTVGEWEEWGNPNQSKFLEYMLQYSPYDNVEAKPYPSLLVTAGLNDPRVQYWEPLKWVSKLRALKTNPETPLYLKTDMSSGHFSASDRYKFLRETAFEYAFIVDQIVPK